MATLKLDIANFRLWHPKFANADDFPDELIQAQWESAALFVGLTDEDSVFGYEPDADPPVMERKVAMYYVLCHLLSLQKFPDGMATPVGAVTEGSTSITAASGRTYNSDEADYWNRTPCGASFWMMIKDRSLGGRFYPGDGFYHPWG